MKIKKESPDANTTAFSNKEAQLISEKTAAQDLRTLDATAKPQPEEKKDYSDVFARLKKSTRKKSAGIF